MSTKQKILQTGAEIIHRKGYNTTGLQEILVFQKKLSKAIDTMVDYYTMILSEAQAAGEISKDINAKEAANFIVAGWHGALIRMKVSKGVEPLRNHKKFVFNYVLKS